MESKPVLYSYYRSAPSWRVRFALALKGIEYEYVAVNIHKEGGQGEQHDPEYKKKNPQGQVPCLFIDGTYLSQSLAIIEYIEETRPNGKSLFPKDPIKRAKARAIAEIVNSGMQPLQAGPVLRNLDQEKRKDFLQHFFTKGFNAIEEILKQTSGKYCIDDEVTIADICLVSIILNANFNKVSIDEYPLVNRINEELSKLPEYKASHPSAQPDCPPDYK